MTVRTRASLLVAIVLLSCTVGVDFASPVTITGTRNLSGLLNADTDLSLTDITFGTGNGNVLNVDVPWAPKGTLGIAAGQAGSIFTASGRPLAFSGASGSQNGGVISNSSATLFSVSGDGRALFVGNNATANGGAVYSLNGPVVFGGGAVFSGNTAGADGGAIYGQSADHGFTVGHGAVFTGNTAAQSGGAVRTNDSLILLGSEYSSSLVAGNKANGISNFASLGGSLAVQVGSMAPLTARNRGGVLDMRDPVYSASGLSSKNGHGVWLLGGDNRFGGGFSVEGGALHLYRAGEVVNGSGSDVQAGKITLSGAGSSFILDGKATLSSGGGNVIAANTVNLRSGSILAFDLAHHSDGGAANTQPMLNLQSSNFTGSNGTVDLLSLANSAGTYTLAETNQSTFAGRSLTLRGEDPGQTRVAGQITLSNSGDSLELVQSVGPGSLLLVWTGDNTNNWNATAADNWGSSPAPKFLHGDIVQFDNTGRKKEVLVNAGGVAVGSMLVVDGAKYTFISEASPGVAKDSGIVIDKKSSTHIDADGKLKITGGASVDFTGITGVNRFTGGILLSGSSTLRIGNASHLGTEFRNVDIVDGAPTFVFAKPRNSTVPQYYAFTGYSSVRDSINRVSGTNVASGNFLTLTAEADVHVSFANITGAADGANPYGGAVYSNGKLRFNGAGTFSFAGNTALNGGALYAQQELSFTANNSLFAGNAALTGSAGKGGALYSDGPIGITGKNIVFSGNSAASGGGAIYATGALGFTGDEAVFSGNSAAQGGGAIYASSSLTFSGKNAVFSANKAADGGVFYATSGDVGFFGYARLLDNSATGRGGAIYAQGNVTLQATGGDIIFDGNKAGGVRNAMHMSSTGKTLKLRADSGAAVRFYDGVSSDGLTTVEINGVAGDGGLVLFHGAQSASEFSAKTTVHRGNLVLEDGTTYGKKTAGTSFSLKAGAVLTTDVHGNALKAETVSLADKSVLAFGLGNAVRQGVGGSTFNLKVDAGTVTITGSSLVRVYSIPETIGTYGLIDSTNLINAPSGSAFSLYLGDAKTPYVTERNASPGHFMYDLAAQASGRQLVLKVADASAKSSNLQWNTGNGVWKHTPLGKTDRNWQGFVADNIPVFTYLDGDVVAFQQTPSPAGTRKVTVASEGVKPTGMVVKASSYTFDGGDISVQGNVNVHSSGTAVFEGGALKAKGTATIGGTLGLAASADRIALAAKNVQFASGSTLNITGYTPGAIPNPYDGGKLGPVTVISATDSLSALPNTVTVAGQATSDFISAVAYKEKNTVKVAASLAWYSTNAASKAHGDFTIASGQNFELGAVLADNSASTNLRGAPNPWDGNSLTKKGNGTLTLTAANTYTGKTSVTGGTLALKNEGSIASSLLDLSASGAGFDISAATPASGEVALKRLTGVSGSKVVLGANTLVIGADNSNSTFAGDISGSGGLGKTGKGTLALSGSNSYSGGTNLRSGTLLGGAANSFSAKSLHTVASGAKLDLGGYAQTVAGLSGNGTAVLGSSTLAVSNSGPVGAAVFTGALTGSGVFKVQKGGQSLRDANLSGYSGSFAANAGGELLLASGGALALNNALRGNGTVSLAAGSQGDSVKLEAAVGSAFRGTVNLQKGTMQLDADAGKALAKATLLLERTSGRAKVVEDRSIGNLSLGGGTLMFDSLAASQWARAGLLSVDDLAVTHGKVMLQVIPVAGKVSDQNFFDYAHEVGEQLVAAGGTVNWDGTPLSLTDYKGTVVEHSDVSDIVQAGEVTGKGYYGHMAKVATSGADKGISLVYSLTKIEALPGKTVVLDSSDAQSASPMLHAQLTGAGNFTFSGTQAVTVSNTTNNYTGATLIENTVSAGGDNALGQTSALTLDKKGRFNLSGYKQTVKKLSGAGAIDLGSKGGLLDVQQNADSTYAGELTGSGVLRKTGKGTLTLDGSVGKAVATSVSGGGLTVSGQMDGSLDAENAAILVSGTVNGPARFTDSTTAVSGNLFASSSLSGGRMDILDGGRAGQIAVGKGASLGFAGSASATSLTINSGGTLEAGTGGSAASLVMNKGASLKAMNGGKPLSVSGAAVFSMGKGDIVASLGDGRWLAGQHYDILQAPGAGAADLYTLFNGQEISHLLYTGMFNVRNGLLSLYIEGNSFDELGLTYNERNALDAGLSLPKDSPVRNALWEIASSGSKRDLARAGDMLSGEMHADITAGTAVLARMYTAYMFGRLSSQSIVANKTRLRSMPSLFAATGEVLQATGRQHGTGRAFIDASAPEAAAHGASFVTASGGAASPDGYAFSDILGRRHSLWASVGGSYTSFDNTGGISDSQLYGPEVSGGYDLRTDDNWLLGLGFRYGYKKFSIDNRDDDADINSYTVSLYGGKEWNAGPGIFRALLGGAYTLHTVDTERQVRLPSFRDSLEAEYNAHSFQVFTEAAYAVKALDNLVVEPYLAFAWNRNRAESFTEKGGAARLRSSGHTHDNYTTYLGSRLHVPASDRFAFNLDLNWMHTFGGVAPKSVMRFADGGKQFSIKGAGISRDALGVGLSADFKITQNVNLNIGYTGMFGERDKSHGGSATFTLQW